MYFLGIISQVVEEWCSSFPKALGYFAPINLFSFLFLPCRTSSLCAEDRIFHFVQTIHDLPGHDHILSSTVGEGSEVYLATNACLINEIGIKL